MLIKTKSGILSSEITDRAIFESRREFIKSASLLSAGLMLPDVGHAETGKYKEVPNVLTPQSYPSVSVKM